VTEEKSTGNRNGGSELVMGVMGAMYLNMVTDSLDRRREKLNSASSKLLPHPEW
jgi:hypothetical protein